VRENPYTVDAPLATYARGWNLDAADLCRTPAERMRQFASNGASQKLCASRHGLRH
jgi:hypothetical protein